MKWRSNQSIADGLHYLLTSWNGDVDIDQDRTITGCPHLVMQRDIIKDNFSVLGPRNWYEVFIWNR